MKKKVFIVIILSLFGMLVFSMCHANRVKEAHQKELGQSASSSKKHYDNSEFGVMEKSRETLESTQVKLSDKGVSETLNEVMSYLASVENISDVSLTYANHLSISSREDVQTMITMLKVGYVYDANSVEIYKSNSANVYQFLATLRKGDETLGFTGNYVIETKQIELAGLYGEPTGVANK